MLSREKSQVAAALAPEEDSTVAAEGWGNDEELGIDDEEGTETEQPPEGEESAGWDVEEVDLPPEIEAAAPAVDQGYYSPPTKGIPTTQYWVNNSQLVVDHILAGSFETAFRLLNDQVGVVEFGAYQSLFMNTFTRAKTSFDTLPNIPSSYAYPQRNWKGCESKKRSTCCWITPHRFSSKASSMLPYDDRWEIPRSHRKVPSNFY